jgi:parvulin-like peptidyl-prolyl isomerase
MAFRQKKAPGHEKGASDSIIRRFKANPLVFVGTILILVIVIVAFVLVPAIVPEYDMGGGADLTFGFYDKVPITWVPGNFFAQQQKYAEDLRRRYDPQNYQYAGFQIWQEAFNSAAVHTAILLETKQSNYTVPEKTVDREVASLPQFQENGRFSAALYQRYSRKDQLALWRRTQEDLTKQLYVSDITGMLKSSAEGKFIGRMSSPRRKFEMVSFSVDAYPDSEYLSYAEEYPELFRTVHLSQITIKAGEREARQILASIKDGTTTFEDAARTQSQDEYAERGGDMGIKLAHELRQEIPEEADREGLLSLAKGEFSEVIKLESGWAFFRVEEAAKAADFSGEAALEKVRSYVRNFERGRMENRAIAEARDFIALANETGFSEAAYQRRLEKRGFGPLPLNYGNVNLFPSLQSFSVPELSNSESNENFWRTAFGTPLNTLSEPLVQGSNVLVLIPVEETEVEESGIEEIASSYAEYWLSYMTEQSVGVYFLNDPKMDNRFVETYFRYFLPVGN